MLLLFFSLFLALFAAIIYNLISSKKKALFEKIFANIQLPICIINEQGIIKSYNLYFNQQFENIINKKEKFETIFNIKEIANQSYFSNKENVWQLQYLALDQHFCIMFQPLKKESLNWWKTLPFAIGIINKNLKLQSANLNLENILDNDYKNKCLSELAPQFNLKQAQGVEGQELLWHSKMGIIPVQTWVQPYHDDYMLILENKIEFIKLKNKAQEAQHLQIMGQLASSIIHDFNNLLMAISGLSDALESTIPNNETLNLIRENTHHASNLANELLNFVKNKARENHLCNPAEFLNSRFYMLEKMLGSQINLEISAKYNGLVELSATQLEQIILNMAINSKDAMINSNHKTNYFKIIQKKKRFLEKIKIRNVLLEVGEYFVIEVSDNGNGIDESNVSKIFAPFFSTKEKGVGLGLASSLQLVQHTGGTIDFITSTMGTKFIIYLPVIKAQLNKEAEDKQKKSDINETSQQGDIDIIFVEDEQIILNLAKKALVEEKYIVSANSCGQDALNAIESHPRAKLLITDAMLPDIDGITLAQKAQEINKNIKIIIISGYGYEDLLPKIKKQLTNINNVYYLGKPFTLKTLKIKINELINK